MYFSPNWQNEILRLLPFRELFRQLFPHRNLARMLARTGSGSLDDILYRELVPKAEPAPLALDMDSEYPTPEALYQLTEPFSEPADAFETLVSDQRAFITPRLPHPEPALTPAAEIDAAISEMRGQPLEAPEPPQDELFEPMFDMPF